MTRLISRSLYFLASLVAVGLPQVATAQDDPFATLEAYRGQVSIVRL